MFKRLLYSCVQVGVVSGSGVATPQLHSQYQLLGGSVALKKQ